ncbi:MAG: alpha/beta hydrolase [Deltaproteobacteria bacterium]|nr:alpha/beta hydrolase [Deltaproteobacteria bacterium]
MSGINRDPISTDNTEFSSYYTLADENVELLVMQWQPIRPESDVPIIFVAGWISAISGWADFLGALARKQPVFYIETREKESARVEIKKPKPNDFSIERMSKDLMNVCNSLPVNMEQAILMGSSLGATALLEALKHNTMTARAAFLIGPNSEFKAPAILKPLIDLPHSFFYIIKYFVIWYIRTFRVDAKKEPEQMKRYDETLRTAHMQRLKLSAKAAIKMNYQIWPDIETIQTPVALAYAPTDTLHTAENIHRMAESMPRATTVTCESNKYMHSSGLVDDVDNFIKSIDG